MALFLIFAAMASGPADAVRNVADFQRAASPTCGIQEAIDSLPAGGGVVRIGPGRFLLRHGLLVPSQVTLRGAGPATVLTRPKEASATLARAARKGELSVEVDRTDGFRPGDEVSIFDDRMHGWYAAHAIVKEVAPRRITFAAPITSGHPEGLFEPKRHAVVVNYFPMVCGGREPGGGPAERIAILDLTFDGNMAENPGPWTDFTISAIHFHEVSDALVRNCTVRGSVGDGIGVQGGRDNRVESCLAERCRGHGFHPGTSLSGAVFSGNAGSVVRAK